MRVNSAINSVQQWGAHLLARVESFRLDHTAELQTAGLITTAVLVGGAGGFLLAKGALGAKGALVAKELVTAKASTAAAPVLTNQTINTSVVGLPAIVDQLTKLFQNLSANATPLTVGAIGGGAAGVGATRYQVGKLQAILTAQETQSAAAQAHSTAALSAAQRQLQELQTQLDLQRALPLSDNLEVIKGIGRVLAQKLNHAGIYTFADLAVQTPEGLRAIIGTGRTSSLLNPADWIAQAQALVQGSTAAGTA